MTGPDMAKAATGVSRCDLRISNRLAGAIGEQAYNERHAACQSLRRLTARISFLCDWRDDLAERIDRAMRLQERGALFRQEQDDLIDAVRAWRLATARVALGLDAVETGRAA